MTTARTRSTASSKKARSHQARRRAENRRRLGWAVGVAAILVAVGAVVLLQQREPDAGGAAVVGGDLHSLVTPDGRTFFVGGHSAVSVSRDGGATWSRVSNLDDADAMGWAFLDDAVVVGGHPGLSVSTDGGVTFERSNEGLPHTDIHALGGEGALLYAASPGAGFLASDDGGATWAIRNPQVGQSFMGHILVDPDDPEHAIAPDMQVGAVETRDGGTTWHGLGGVPGAMWVSWDPSDIQYIVVTGGGTAAASTDGGATWTPIQVPTGTTVVEIDPSEPARLFAAVHDGDAARIWRSEDSGLTWTET